MRELHHKTKRQVDLRHFDPVIAVWGLNRVILKYLVHDVDPLLSAEIRLPLAGLFFMPFIWKKYGWHKPTVLLGAGKTAVFINGLPFAGMAAAILLLHEKVGVIHLAAFVLTTAGIVIASRKAPPEGVSETNAA